ncbi:MAG: hypothetical protein R3F19_20750 [Verrucomicrobiales bacterium]
MSPPAIPLQGSEKFGATAPIIHGPVSRAILEEGELSSGRASL